MCTDAYGIIINPAEDVIITRGAESLCDLNAALKLCAINNCNHPRVYNMRCLFINCKQSSCV